MSVAEQAGLSLTWSQTLKTGFLVTRLILVYSLNWKTETLKMKDLTSKLLIYKMSTYNSSSFCSYTLFFSLECNKMMKVGAKLEKRGYTGFALSFWNSVVLSFCHYSDETWISLRPVGQCDQILCEASLWWGKGCIRFWDRLDQNSGFHGNRKRPLIGKTISPPFLGCFWSDFFYTCR